MKIRSVEFTERDLIEILKRQMAAYPAIELVESENWIFICQNQNCYHLLIPDGDE